MAAAGAVHPPPSTTDSTTSPTPPLLPLAATPLGEASRREQQRPPWRGSGSADATSPAPRRSRPRKHVGPPLPAQEVCVVGKRRRIFAFRLSSYPKWVFGLHTPLEAVFFNPKHCALPKIGLGSALAAPLETV